MTVRSETGLKMNQAKRRRWARVHKAHQDNKQLHQLVRTLSEEIAAMKKLAQEHIDVYHGIKITETQLEELIQEYLQE